MGTGLCDHDKEDRDHLTHNAAFKWEDTFSCEGVENVLLSMKMSACFSDLYFPVYCSPSVEIWPFEWTFSALKNDLIPL